jgi:hypothetical protein
VQYIKRISAWKKAYFSRNKLHWEPRTNLLRIFVSLRKLIVAAAYLVYAYHTACNKTVEGNNPGEVHAGALLRPYLKA